MRAGNERPGEAGTTLIETIVAVAILAIFTVVAAGLWTHRVGTAMPIHRAFAAAYAAARAQAAADGATLALDAADAAGVSRFSVCPGRPRSAGGSFGMGCAVVGTVSSSIVLDGVGPPPWAIFLDPSGSASVAAWQSGTLLTAEPICSATVGIVVDGVRTGVLDCVAGAIVDAAPG